MLMANEESPARKPFLTVFGPSKGDEPAIRAQAERVRTAHLIRFLKGLGHWAVRNVLWPLMTHHLRKELRYDLMELDDHMLKDIGLTREDIPDVVATSFCAEYGEASPLITQEVALKRPSASPAANADERHHDRHAA